MKTNYFAFMFVCVCSLIFCDHLDDEHFERDIKKVADQLDRDYNINMIFCFDDRAIIDSLSHGQITAVQALPSEIYSVVDMLNTELKIYPRIQEKRIVFRNVIVCKDLRISGNPVGAISDFTHRILYVGVDEIKINSNAARRTIHHEVFHIIDAKNHPDSGDLSWEKLNDQSFLYNKKSHGRQWIESPGFLSGYSMNSIEEDKAEIFSFMICEYTNVINRSNKDLVVKRKISYLKKELLLFDKGFDNMFWSSFENRGRVLVVRH